MAIVRIYMYADRPDLTGAENGGQEDQTGSSFPSTKTLPVNSTTKAWGVNPATTKGSVFTYNGQTFTEANHNAYLEFDDSQLGGYSGANHKIGTGPAADDHSDRYMEDDGATVAGNIYFKKPDGTYIEGTYDGTSSAPAFGKADIFLEDSWQVYELDASGARVGNPFWVGHIEATDLNALTDANGTPGRDGDSFTISERPLVNGTRYEVVRYDETPSNAEGTSMPLDAVIPCFVRGTLIKTARGCVAIENIQSGDMVITKDHGFQLVRWIGSRVITAAELSHNPSLLPIRIRQGALGLNNPTRDLLVSPQHRILVRSKIAQRMFGTQEVLIAAKHLLTVDGVEIARNLTETEYFHMLFEQHGIVFANGAEAESLYPGQEAMKSFSEAAREEIFTIFPELRDFDYNQFKPLAARKLCSGRESRKLAERHVRNGQRLLKHA